jgi:phosphoglycerol transferase MdoB-like AlkP superfamily enzyme
MLDVAATALPLAAPRPARSAIRPDIIVIQHESVFDPRVYGLSVDERIIRFLAPADGCSGRLHVDIYGGGSWQTEFSLLTGLSSASFGPDSYFLFKKGVGRFRHSLPSQLAGLGYRTMLATSCRRNFMNYDAFYAGIGVDERVFSDEFPPPFDLAAFEITNSDTAFFQAAEGAFDRSLDRDPAPRFLMALTNFNHGPHESRLIAPGEFEDERRSALSAVPDPNYGEYYARLSETAASYAAFKAALAARGRPTLIVRYGDHQPTMTRALEALHGGHADDNRLFETFFALEALNFEPDFSGIPDQLDIAMLGSIALQASGLPLDAVTATRLALLPEIGPAYVASPLEAKRRFHRTLVDAGLIELGPAPAVLPIAAERA